MKTAKSSETLIPYHTITWRHDLADHEFNPSQLLPRSAIFLYNDFAVLLYGSNAAALQSTPHKTAATATAAATTTTTTATATTITTTTTTTTICISGRRNGNAITSIFSNEENKILLLYKLSW
jgi:hypothetical protein